MATLIHPRPLIGVPDLQMAKLFGLQSRDLSIINLDSMKIFQKCDSKEGLMWMSVSPIRGLSLIYLTWIHWTRM